MNGAMDQDKSTSQLLYQHIRPSPPIVLVFAYLLVVGTSLP